MTEIFFKVNALMVAPFFILSLTCGSEVLSFISKGKYGSSSAIVFSLLLLLLMLETFRMQVEVLIQAVEKYGKLLMCNFLLSVSIVPAFFLLNYIDSWCLPALNVLGLIMSNSMVLHILRRDGFNYVHDWESTIRIIGVVLLVLISIFMVKFFIVPHWLIVAFLSLTFYFLFLFIFYRGKLVELFYLFRSSGF